MADNKDMTWTFRPEVIERLQQLWDEGKASGPAAPFDIARAIAEARARLKDVAKEK